MAAQLSCGGNDNNFIANASTNPKMKEFLKSVIIWQSYEQKYRWSFLTNSV